LKKKPKICFFSPQSYEFFLKTKQVTHGGAELQMYFLAKKLSEISDFQILFFVGNYEQPKIEIVDNVKLIRTIQIEKKENIFMKFLKSVKLFFLLIKFNSDVIISTTSNSIVGVISVYKTIFRKKHIHRTAHLIDVDNTWISQNQLLGKIYKFGLFKANKIITQNKEHQNLLLKNYNLKSEILKNCFQISEIKKVLKFDFLWIGRFENWKNPQLFVELANKISDYKFVMICPYSKSDFENWKLLKNEADKHKNLTFIEKVPFYEIQEYFNQSAIFVNTSTSEGFPNIFLQAALAKLPIISLNVNPDNFITDYNCGIYCENSFEKLLESLKYLIENKIEISEKGENSFSYLKENHDIEKISLQFKSIIESIL
jgi:glycosyltransferase involved in cell wall biosynthesis